MAAPTPILAPAARKRVRLGWLGPALVLVGMAAAAVATWYIVRAKPEVGEVIDTIAIDERRAFVVRAEAGDRARNFVELRRRAGGEDELVWRALVPAYGGRPGAPGIAWSDTAVSIRVVRNERAEIFALSMTDAAKLGGFRLAPNHGPIRAATTGPVTLTDHVRSYELVAGPDWHQLVAIELASGEGLWRQELGPAPIDDAGIEERGGARVVWIRQGDARRAFRAETGAAVEPKAP